LDSETNEDMIILVCEEEKVGETYCGNTILYTHTPQQQNFIKKRQKLKNLCVVLWLF
jgi:hypothetical protein